MTHDLLKICADSLRTLIKEKYDIKLKAAHAHELVAAFLGYSTKNAMLADTKYPISNLHQVEIVVAIPDEAIDQRRKNLKDLPEELPDSHMLGKAVYSSLLSNKLWQSPEPLFTSFEEAAKYIVEHNDPVIKIFFINGDHPFHLIVDKKITEDSALLTVYNSYRNTSGEMECSGIAIINLPRLVGHIGYGMPKMTFNKLGPGARRTLDSLGVNYV